MGRRERVLILYNEPVLSSDHPDYAAEAGVLWSVSAVADVLVPAGYEIDRLGITSDPQALLSGLREKKPDVVVNLFEGTQDNNASELYVAGLLEWLGISYTG